MEWEECGSGDRASYIAIKMTMELFKNLPEQFFNNETLKYRTKSGDIKTIDFNELLVEHLAKVNDEIVSQLGRGPGTTFSAAIVRQKEGKEIITSISVGDSKILKIGRDGKIEQLVKDDGILYDGIKGKHLYILPNDRNTIYSNNPYTAYDGNREFKTIPYRPLKQTDNAYFLKEDDTRFYEANNIIVECLGAGRSGKDLKSKIYRNPSNFLSEHEFKKGEKIFLCSDGIGDNLTAEDYREIFYTKKNARECLKDIINRIYEIQKEKMTYKTNKPNVYIQNHSEFSNCLKGSSDNISGIVIENEGEER